MLIDEEKLNILKNHDILTDLDLFKNIDTDKTIKINHSRTESNYSKREVTLSDRFGSNVFFTEDSLTRLCALVTATELLKKIDLHNLSLSTLENLLGITPKPATEPKLPEITVVLQKVIGWNDLTRENSSAYCHESEATIQMETFSTRNHPSMRSLVSLVSIKLRPFCNRHETTFLGTNAFGIGELF